MSTIRDRAPSMTHALIECIVNNFNEKQPFTAPDVDEVFAGIVRHDRLEALQFELVLEKLPYKLRTVTNKRNECGHKFQWEHRKLKADRVIMPAPHFDDY